jgi:hypothetical protein
MYLQGSTSTNEARTKSYTKSVPNGQKSPFFGAFAQNFQLPAVNILKERNYCWLRNFALF